jgi:pimeloyl-ACP methyl ester carboxylesterase
MAASGHSGLVVMFDNSGIGRTQELPTPLTVDAMADQTSALIDTLGLGRTDVLGWSMGGMIAQALAVLHPAQVSRLVLCATSPGTGAAVPPSQAALQAGSDFPANQVKAYAAFRAAISEYRPPRWRRPPRRRLRGSPQPTGRTASMQPGTRSPRCQCPRSSPTVPKTSSTR